MITPFVTGFGIGAGLIIAIGAQNAFVLRQGLARQHVFAVAAICAICDAVLIVAGVAGLGALIQANPSWMTVIAGGGVAFLVWYGIKALRRALSPVAMQVEGNAADLRTAIVTCLTFTLLNPHVYLDTVVLVGALSGPFQGPAKLAYGLGAASASFVWFFGLAYGARLLAPLFTRPAAWRVLDLIIAAIMFLIAAKLGVFLWTGAA
jgi:L-lysine exporter family protein LysE/ArgO